MSELDARRGRALIEENPEAVVFLDADGVVLAASRRARQRVEEGERLPPELLEDALVVPVGEERLVYLGGPGAAAYEELRSGFTAAVSHELRTPLARLYSLLETALLPGERPHEYVEQARAEVDRVRELIDDVLFLSELESGSRVISLGATPVLAILREVVEERAERALRAGMTLHAEGDERVELAVRPRMLRVIAANLADNALRYAGEPATRFVLSVSAEPEGIVLRAVDDGVGVGEEHLPRLFERFYRADASRTTGGTGLGLAIVKHVVAAAGGAVEARGGPGRGLEIRCTFPTS